MVEVRRGPPGLPGERAMTVSYVNGYLGHGIFLGAGYSADFVLGPDGEIKAKDVNAGQAYSGVTSLVQNADLTNNGHIYGSQAVNVTGHGAAGGVGGVMALAGD